MNDRMTGSSTERPAPLKTEFENLISRAICMQLKFISSQWSKVYPRSKVSPLYGITATIKERMRKLIPKCEEIIQIANTPIIGGLRNSNIAFKLFESLVVQPLLNNCASWIGITEKHVNELQKFQNKFVRRVLHLPHSVTQAILDYDIGKWPMGCCIKERKWDYRTKEFGLDTEPEQ